MLVGETLMHFVVVCLLDKLTLSFDDFTGSGSWTTSYVSRLMDDII